MAEQFTTEIYGTEAAASVGNRDSVELYTTLSEQAAKVQLEVPNDALGSYARLIDNFVRYLDGDPTAEIVTPAQALTSVRIIDGIMRSAEEGHEISLTAEGAYTPHATPLQKV
jgi:predicted dehydrogenase